MKSLIYIVAITLSLIFMPAKSDSEPIKIALYKEISVPVICHVKEAFLEVVKAFVSEGRTAGLAVDSLNRQLGICYSRQNGYDFRPDKIVDKTEATAWSGKGVILEGTSQRANGIWETMYAWVAANQLSSIRLGDDV